ncbi:MAG TPA: hypothetical protein VH186_32830 [Chloroflexia bacterium]|nr:hypothetical protein [Chloroflexia bacterium]
MRQIKFLKDLLIEARKQLFEYQAPQAIKETIFTKKAIQSMKAWGLSEKDLVDVIVYGQQRRPLNKFLVRTRKYYGYEIGVLYKMDAEKYATIVISCWKRERR